MPLPLVLTEEFHVDEGKTAVGAAFITSAWPDHPGRWTYIPDPMRDRLVEERRAVGAAFVQGRGNSFARVVILHGGVMNANGNQIRRTMSRSVLCLSG